MKEIVLRQEIVFFSDEGGKHTFSLSLCIPGETVRGEGGGCEISPSCNFCTSANVFIKTSRMSAHEMIQFQAEFHKHNYGKE